MTRFFISPDEMTSDLILLIGENAAHARVLRLKPGEKVLICDGSGSECLCEIEDSASNDVRLAVLERRHSDSEASVKASVYIGFPKADKLEHVIQKATELGAFEIIAFPSVRCISKPDEKSLSKKLDRWQKIAYSAAEQSGRGYVPKVTLMPNYTAALERAALADKAILFYENETATTLHMELDSANFSTISLITGPEGGFEEGEIAQAKSHGISICTLGKRILRCETAPLCALSAVMYASGEF